MNNAAGEMVSHGFVRQQVAVAQRLRIIAAMAEVSSEAPFEPPSISQITDRARVSRTTFYALFNDRDDCYLATFDEAVGRAAARMIAAYETQQPWTERVRAALCALLEFFEEEPRLARLCVLDAPCGGPEVLSRRAQALHGLATALDCGRVADRGSPSPVTAEAVVGGAFAIIHKRLLFEPSKPMSGLVNPLMSMIVYAYHGRGRASRELARATPPPRFVPSDGESQPLTLERIPFRVTHRTLMVLMAVANEPGSNNQEIAEAAGITDPGQISKLLARLKGLRLMENTGEGQARGEPNAWSITADGRAVLGTILGQVEQHTNPW